MSVKNKLIREAVVLAGGKGTRLRNAIASDLPKPMAEVAGKPFLVYLLNRLSDQRIRHVILAVGYKAAAIEKYFGVSYRGMHITYSREDSPLGTGGALKRALSFCRDEWVLALNGDSYCDFNSDVLLTCKNRVIAINPLVSCIVGCVLHKDADRYGGVSFDAEGKIKSFIEKGESCSQMISSGVYLIKKDAFANYPKAFSIEYDFFERMASEGRIYGCVFEGRFIDIGTPESYKSAHEILRDICLPARIAFFDWDGTINVDIGHLHDSKDLVLIPEAVDLIRNYNRKGYKVVVVTNQAGIAKGLYTETDMHILHDVMDEALADEDAYIDAYYFCPHHPDFTGECSCRKPEPGMLLKALSEFEADPSSCIMHGDKPKDAEAAKRAGVPFARVGE